MITKTLILAGVIAGLGAGAAARTPLAAQQQSGAPAARDSTAAAKAKAKETPSTIEIYGFAQGDAIYDFGSNDPNWFDVNRPTKLPAFKDEFGFDGHTWLSARQTRFGVKTSLPTDHGDMKATFEFDMFGVGVDAGQTTIRLRLAYGQWGHWGAGQLWSPFMDIDVFPNVLDYWGPNGMIFFRNVMVFYEPVNDSTQEAMIAVERPGASGDAGQLADREEIENLFARFPAPDLSAGYKRKWKWGYVKAAGILRWFRWDDVFPDTFDLSGGTTGWGASLSSNINAGKRDVFRLQVDGGRGIQNYYNDAPVDVAVRLTPNDIRRPFVPEALPIWGLVAYLDHTWDKDEKWKSSIGYSRVSIDNSDGQLPDAFRIGQYGSVNVTNYPTDKIMMGAEFQWGYRHDFTDPFRFNDYRLQFSFKYSYSRKFGGKDD